MSELCLLGLDGAGKSTILDMLVSSNNRVRVIHWTNFERIFSSSLLFSCNLTPQEFIVKVNPDTATNAIRYLASLELEMSRRMVDSGFLPIIDSYWIKVASKLLVLGQIERHSFMSLCQDFPIATLFIETPPSVAIRRKAILTPLERPPNGRTGEDFFAAIREEMLCATEGNVIATLDGTMAPDHIYMDLASLVDDFFGVLK